MNSRRDDGRIRALQNCPRLHYVSRPHKHLEISFWKASTFRMSHGGFGSVSATISVEEEEEEEEEEENEEFVDFFFV